jgi:hypothetical protein
MENHAPVFSDKGRKINAPPRLDKAAGLVYERAFN